MTFVERISFEYGRSRYIFIHPVSGETRKRVDRMEVTERCHEKICSVLREELANRGMPRLFDEGAWHPFLEMRDDYTKYPMLEQQNRRTGYWGVTVASEGGQGNLMPGANSNIDHLPKGVDDDDK